MARESTMARKHVLITGTGRAGTTFLVQLLTNLGLDTGFTKDNMPIDKTARAGLEHGLLNENAPYIVKCPSFIEQADEVLGRDDIMIEHAFIPIRDLYAAAESRRHVVREEFKKLSILKKILYRLNLTVIPGGLTRTRNASKQEFILATSLYDLLLKFAEHSIPVTLMHYPLLTKDCDYLYEQLKPILNDIDSDLFRATYNKTVRPDLVSDFEKNHQ